MRLNAARSILCERSTEYDKPVCRNMTQQSLIVAATQRSGSTLFCRDLELSAAIGTPREWLQHSDLEERIRAYGLKPGTPYAEVIREIVKRETNHRGLFAMKIMWDTLDAFFDIMRKDHPDETGPTKLDTFRRLFPNPRFVFINRRDKLRQAVSFVKSLQSGAWVSREGKRPASSGILRFDYIAVREAVEKFEKEESLWREFFEQHTIPFAEFAYEDFVQDRSGSIKKALSLIGERPGNRETPLKNEIRRMSDDINRQWRQAFLHTVASIHDAGPPQMPPVSQGADAQCVPLSAPAELQASEKREISVRIRNTGSDALPHLGAEDGSEWVQLRAYWQPGTKRIGIIDGGRGYLPRSLAPNEAGDCAIVVQAPDIPGDYTLQFDLWSNASGWITTPQSDGLGSGVRVVPRESARLAAELFPDAEIQIGGWQWIPWLGHVNTDNTPWLLHAELGWILVGLEGSKGGDFWFFLKPLGWTKTSVSEFPLIWIQQRDEWVRFIGREGADFLFERLDDGERFSIPGDP
jgi:LPS sulfotransferase NodH